jgi:hypothetical protein
MDNLLVVHPLAHFDAGQANHPPAGKGVKRAVDQHTELLFTGHIQNRLAIRLVPRYGCPRLEQVEGKLDHPKMVVTADGFGNRPDTRAAR